MSEKLSEPGATPTDDIAALHSADLDLVREARAGRRDAVDRFVTRMSCVPRMLARQNQRIGRALPPAELADLTQDVLVVIWKKLEGYEGRSSLETWAFRVCRLELMNGLRRTRRLPRSLGEGAGDDREEPAPHSHGEAEAALAGLERLGPPGSDVIRLKHFDQLTFDQIAARLGISPNTAKTQYYRGLLRLREILSEERPEASR